MHYSTEQSVEDIVMNLSDLLYHADKKLLSRMTTSGHCIHQLLLPSTVLHEKLRSSEFVFSLPHCHCNLYKRSFVKLNNLDVLFIVLLMPYLAASAELLQKNAA